MSPSASIHPLTCFYPDNLLIRDKTAVSSLATTGFRACCHSHEKLSPIIEYRIPDLQEGKAIRDTTALTIPASLAIDGSLHLSEQR